MTKLDNKKELNQNRIIWFKGEPIRAEHAKVQILSPTVQFGLNVFVSYSIIQKIIQFKPKTNIETGLIFFYGIANIIKLKFVFCYTAFKIFLFEYFFMKFLLDYGYYNRNGTLRRTKR